MIGNLLILVSIVVIGMAYLNLLKSYWKGNRCNRNEMTGFELAKEITSNYDEINIVESNEVWMSQYDMKRNIIRLIPGDYEGNHVFTLAMVSQLAGYSLLKIQGNSYLKILQYFFSKINGFAFSSGISILIAWMTNTVGDAKIGLLLLGIILVYQYFRVSIQEFLNELLKKGYHPDSWNFIEEVNDSFLFLHKSSFIVTLILMLREIIIILNI